MRKSRMIAALVPMLAALGFSSIGLAFAASPQIGMDSTCPDGTYPITCGAITITASSENGFSGTVSLTSSVSPSCSTGYCLTPTLNPTSVTLSSGGSGTSSLTFTHSCNFSIYLHCDWTVTVTGTSGTINNSTSVFVCYGKSCPI